MSWQDTPVEACSIHLRTPVINFMVENDVQFIKSFEFTAENIDKTYKDNQDIPDSSTYKKLIKAVKLYAEINK